MHNPPIVQISQQTTPLVGQITLPGSKSITNRALLVAALCNGESTLTGVLRSDDTKHMTTALKQLGVSVQDIDATTIKVRGNGALSPSKAPLFLGNAGTAMRFLTAASLLINGTTVLDGDEHMRKRPIGSLVEALRSIGANITDTNGCPPVYITGNGQWAIDRLSIDSTLSSQFVSGVLMAAACCRREIEISTQDSIIGGRGYIDITTAVMQSFGATIDTPNNHTWIIKPTGYTAQNYVIEPDASAATYLWAAAKITNSPDVINTNPDNMIQPDAKAHGFIQQFPNLPTIINGQQIQDAIPTLAVMAAFNTTPVRFVGIENLRVKECDRISAICTGLNRIKAGLAEEDGDNLIVHADRNLIGTNTKASIFPYTDHRIAMSFALAGIMMNGLRIENPDCVGKTYPNYWNDLHSLGVAIQ